ADNFFTTETVRQTVTIDTSKPGIYILYPLNITYNHNITSLNYTTTDLYPDSCWYANETGSLSAFNSGGANFTGINISREGSNTWTLYCNDSAGNVNSTSVTFGIVFDNIPPYIAFISPENGTRYNQTSIIVNITNSSDADSVWWYNGSDNLSYTIPVSINLETNNYTFYAYANDSAGNINLSRVDFEVAVSGDTTPPQLNITSPLNQTYNQSSILFNLTLNENGSLCKFTLNNWATNYTMTKLISTNFNYTYSGIANENYTARFWCNDTSNNINNTEQVNFTISVSSLLTEVNITYPTPNQLLVRGRDSDGVQWEDDSGLIANTINITANVHYTGSSGINASTCYFYDNGSLIGSSLTNLTGDCYIGYDKTSRAAGTRQLFVNYSTSEIRLINNSGINITIEVYQAALAMGNLRLVGGVYKYYDGDIAILYINISKSNGTVTNLAYDSQNLSANALNPSGQSRGITFYPGNISRISTGQYMTNITINYSQGALVMWKVNVSDNNYLSYISSSEHSDRDVCSADFGAWSEWSTCSSNSQSRTRTDTSGCVETETQTCTIVGDDDDDDGCTSLCSPSGNESRTCANSSTISLRICGDYNGDGCTEWSPASYVVCTGGQVCQNGVCGTGEVCTPDWRCTEWGDCIGTTRTRTCQDFKYCNTTVGRPNLTEYCDICTWNCTQWSTCTYVGQSEAQRLVGSFWMSIFKINQQFLEPVMSQAKVKEGFKGEYYNSKDLSGKIILTRDDSEINFDWAKGSPDKKININKFSVRWTKTEEFASGKYKFTTRSDDGIRLYIDNKLIINRWNNHAVRTDSAEIILSGEHEIKVEYFENTGKAVAKLSWDALEIYVEGSCDDRTLNQQCSTSKPLFCNNGNLVEDCEKCGCPEYRACTNGKCKIDETQFKGFIGEYFNNKDLQGEPVLVRDDSEINFDWKNSNPVSEISKDYFSIRWTKDEQFDAGRYNFRVISDDGAKLYVDDILILDKWKRQSTSSYEAEANLTSGEHEIKLEYYEYTGKSVISLDYELVGQLTSMCEDGTLYNECSNNTNLFCLGGTLVENCNLCGCSQDYECQINGTCQKIFLSPNLTCSDSTNYGECSTSKPVYCNNGTLVENCNLCGCNEGYNCQINGTCQLIPVIVFDGKCSDGTLDRQCSTTKPLYCNNGTLVSNCTLCSCSSGYTCNINGTCQEIKVKAFEEENTGWIQIRNCSQISGNASCVRPVEARYCAPGCVESWTCSNWGLCISNTQTRNCTDINNCGTSISRPNVSAYCEINDFLINYYPSILDLIVYNGTSINFVASISDTSLLMQHPETSARWYLDGVLVDEDSGVRNFVASYTRTFFRATEIRLEVSNIYHSDEVIWGVDIFDPSEKECTENWDCDWTSCDDSGFSYSVDCVDLNRCGTHMNMPNPRECACIPDWECGAWSECSIDYNINEFLGSELVINGKKERTCVDLEDCEASRIEISGCDSKIPIKTKQVEWCNEPYIEIYDVNSNKLVSRIRGTRIENIFRVDIGFTAGDFAGYCDYCFNGIKDFDEIDTDCGGENCPPCLTYRNIFDWRKIIVYILWLLLLLLLLLFSLYLYYRYRQSKKAKKPGKKPVKGWMRKWKNLFFLHKVRRKERKLERVLKQAEKTRIKTEKKIHAKHKKAARKEAVLIKRRLKKKQVKPGEIEELRKKLKEWKKRRYYGTAKLEEELDKLEGNKFNEKYKNED
ncbi:MAG: PA14 domain-containing protein, partial [archaeon]